MKTLNFIGLTALAAVTLWGQPPTTGTQYWSTTPIDCSLVNANNFTLTLASGGTGYVCVVTGTFPWLAAGGTWGSSIRTSAPGGGAIGVDLSFYDQSGSSQTLDVTSPNGPASTNDVSFVLKANQPSEVRLLGASSEAPSYNTTQSGSVYAIFYCPSGIACATVLPQLLYSFSPIKPWSLSVPIAWDSFFSPLQPQGATARWSAVGINDATHFIGLVIYNQSNVSSIYSVRVYDSDGNLAGQGTTAPIAGFSSVTGEGGTYAKVLSDVITGPLPTGVIKVAVDGGSNFSSVVALQFNPDSATSLQVAYDTTSASSLAVQVGQPKAVRSRVPPTVLPK